MPQMLSPLLAKIRYISPFAPYRQINDAICDPEDSVIAISQPRKFHPDDKVRSIRQKEYRLDAVAKAVPRAVTKAVTPAKTEVNMGSPQSSKVCGLRPCRCSTVLLPLAVKDQQWNWGSTREKPAAASHSTVTSALCERRSLEPSLPGHRQSRRTTSRSSVWGRSEPGKSTTSELPTLSRPQRPPVRSVASRSLGSHTFPHRSR